MNHENTEQPNLEEVSELLRAWLSDSWQYDPSPLAGLYRLTRDTNFPRDALVAIVEMFALNGQAFEDRAKQLYKACEIIMIGRQYRKDTGSNKIENTETLFHEITSERSQRDQWLELPIAQLRKLWDERDVLTPEEQAILRGVLRNKLGIN